MFRIHNHIIHVYFNKFIQCSLKFVCFVSMLNHERNRWMWTIGPGGGGNNNSKLGIFRLEIFLWKGPGVDSWSFSEKTIKRGKWELDKFLPVCRENTNLDKKIENFVQKGGGVIWCAIVETYLLVIEKGGHGDSLSFYKGGSIGKRGLKTGSVWPRITVTNF